MSDIKAMIKTSLRRIHLYEPLHYIWVHRPDLRVASWNFGYRLYGARDHLPIPPARLINYTVNSREISWFLHTGMISFTCLSNALKKNHYSPENFHNVLDFGCGCGRVARYWQNKGNVHIYGSDYNPALIHWDQSHLSRLGDFQTNLLAPPINYPDHYFDFIYALSIFTHFTQELQAAWMNELYRILEPGGLLLITLHGVSRVLELDQDNQTRFYNGEMVVLYENAAGENKCASYHPYNYVIKKLARKFEPVDFIESGARDSDQDIYIFRKPILQ